MEFYSGFIHNPTILLYLIHPEYESESSKSTLWLEEISSFLISFFTSLVSCSCSSSSMEPWNGPVLYLQVLSWAMEGLEEGEWQVLLPASTGRNAVTQGSRLGYSSICLRSGIPESPTATVLVLVMKRIMNRFYVSSTWSYYYSLRQVVRLFTLVWSGEQLQWSPEFVFIR